ncbi:MAG: exodeoxyribonuclease VII small subunit [Epulopiscium sp.]|jgi:exodeoxyribonuclease VII small subunit|nr:exodeoxyribonuclease VII small subunit [Candidatus Epulonipiscium sp.]
MAKKKLKFEEALQRMEEIVEILENEEVPLEDSIALYKEGLSLSAICQEILAVAEGEIVQLQKEAGGIFSEVPFIPKEEDSCEY